MNKGLKTIISIFILLQLSIVSYAQRDFFDFKNQVGDSIEIQELESLAHYYPETEAFSILEEKTPIETIISKLPAFDVDTPSSKESSSSEYNNHLYVNAGSVPSSFNIDKKKAIGDIACTSQVSESGALTMSVPIVGYNTPQDFQPEIAINYSSFCGNGSLGYGWSIGGLSVITRVAKCKYYDGYADGISSSIEDAFALNGQRLIKLKRVADKIFFQTSRGNVKVVAQLNENAIKNFVVFYPDGSKAIFTTNNSNVYYIDKITNKIGRSISYTYESISNHYRIKSISYGMQGEGVVKFCYMRRDGTDHPIAFNAGVEDNYDYLLSDIITFRNTKLIRKYSIYYMEKGMVDLISKIECSNGKESLNPLYFYYGQDDAAKYFTSSQTQLATWYDFKDKPAQVSICRGQFDYGNDNDGIIQFPNKIGYFQGHKDGSLFSHSKNWTENQFSGDEDILISTGLSENLSLATYKIKTGKGFVDIFAVDIDKFGGDEIIKVNDVAGNSADTLIFTIYTPSLYSGLAKKYTRKYILSSLHNGNIVPKYFHCGDFNGDGNNEILVVAPELYLGDKVGTKVTVIDLEADKILFSGSPFSFNANMIGGNRSAQEAFNTSDKMYAVDYDNDGKNDIVIIKDDATYFYSFSDAGKTWKCTLKGSDEQLTNGFVKDKRVLVGDFNGDGKYDLLVSSSKGKDCSWNIFAGTGTASYVKKTISLTSFEDDDTEFYVQDVNQDGQTDLVKKRKEKLTACLIADFKHYTTISANVKENSHVVPTNILAKSKCYSLMFVHNNGEVDKYRLENSDRDSRIMTASINSFGIINSFRYALLNSEFKDTYNYTYFDKNGFKLYKGPLFVVSENKLSFGSKILKDISYVYTNAIVHKEGLGFCGFENVQTYDKITGRRISKNFDPFNFGNLLSSENDNCKYTYSYDVKVSDNKISMVNLNQKKYQDYTNQVCTTTDYLYDSYGNMTAANVSYGNYITSKLRRSYINVDSDSQYVIGLISSESQETDRNGFTYKKTIKNTYDSRYFVVSTTSCINDNKQTQEDYTYDENANVSCKKLYKYSSTKATCNTFTYNQFGQLATRVSGMGIKESLEYNESGLLSSVLDHIRNKESTDYDDWGNICKTIHADGTITNINKSWSDGEAGSLFVITTSETGKPVTKAFYDELGNIVRTSEQHFDGTFFSVDKVYDSRNRLSEVSCPFKENPKEWVAYSYDNYDRICEIKYPSGKVDNYSYSGLSTTFTSSGINTQKTYNAIGDLVSVTDAAGTITYEYSGNGQPRRISLPNGIVTEIKYDVFGRKIQMSDPNTGISTISYDADGNVWRTSDARNQEIISTYDEYDRLSVRTMDGMGATEYHYDSMGNLVSEIRTDGIKAEYEYDEHERLVLQKETNLNGYWFSKSYQYQNGRISTITYCSNRGELAKELYTYRNGVLSTIKLSDGRSIYELSKEDDLGRVAQYYTGDILHKTVFDSDNRIIGQNVLANGKNIQDFEYKYDGLTGNLTERTDKKRSLSESFEYDELNRITTFGNETMDYNENGNIAHCSLVGEYGYSSQMPFAVSSISNSRGLIPKEEQILKYNPLSKISSISEGNSMATFEYDADGNRIMMTYQDENPKKSFDKYYFGNAYEVKLGSSIDRELLYLGGDCYSASAVLMRSFQGDWDLLYICRDNMGSVTAIVNEDGEVIAEQSYDAWGNIRKVDNWEIYAFSGETPTLLIDRGYTGHEHLLMFGLINMNARLYSPLLARFISPDPIVQFADNGQSFNRYTYCLNNPFKGVDINGKSVIAVIGIGALIGAIGNVGVKAISGQINSVGDFFAAFGVGACAGAVASVAVIALGIPTVGVIAGMEAGAIAGFTGGLVTGIGNNAFFGDEFSFKDLAIGTVAACVMGGAVGGVTAKIQGRNIWTGELKNATIKPQVSNVSETNAKEIQAPETMEFENTENSTYDIDITNHNVDLTPLSDQNPTWENPSYKQGTLNKTLILKGCEIDRYSSTLDNLETGTYFAPSGTDYINRAIPRYPNASYAKFKVNLNLSAETAITAPQPSFNGLGGGVEIRFPAAANGITSNFKYLNQQQLVLLKLIIPIK